MMIATWKEGMIMGIIGWCLVVGMCRIRRRRRRRRRISVGFHGIPVWLLGDSSMNN